MEDDRVVLLRTDQLDLDEGDAASANAGNPTSSKRSDEAPRSSSPDDDQHREVASASPAPREPAFLVYLASCAAAVGGVLFGYDMGVISGAKAQMQDELGFSCAQVSAVVAMLPIGGFVASIVGGMAVDKYGRKLTIILNAFLFTLGAIIIAISSSLTPILLGRFVLGFAVSLSAIAECIYISEISTPDRRGALVSLNELAITVGILVSFLVNYIFATCPGGWRYMFSLSCVVAVGQGLAMIFLPRTPQFLVMAKKEREAEQTLRRLNITGDVRQTMADIRHSLADQQHVGGCCGFLSTLANNSDNIGSRLLIGCGLVVFQQFSGQPNILYFAADIFKQVGFCTEWSSTLASVGLGLLKVASTAVSLSIVDRIGRRKALVSGITVMALSVGMMAVVSFNQTDVMVGDTCVEPAERALQGFRNAKFDANANSSSNNTSVVSTPDTLDDCVKTSEGQTSRLLSFFGLVIFVCAYSFSFGPITWVVLSEIFPAATKGRAMALATSLNWLGNTVVSATFLDATAAFSLGGVFLSYSIICVLAIAFVLSMVPETKNKTLEEISKELKAKSTRGMIRDNLSFGGRRQTSSSARAAHHYSILHTRT